jgi:hypothetical protein
MNTKANQRVKLTFTFMIEPGRNEKMRKLVNYMFRDD